MLSVPLEVNVIVIDHSKYCFFLLHKVSEETMGLEGETVEGFTTLRSNSRDHSKAQTLFDQRQVNRQLVS